MIKENNDDIDLLKVTENVSFLADCFDNSFSLQSSLNYIKEYVKEKSFEQHVLKDKSYNLKKSSGTSKSKQVLDSSITETVSKLTELNKNINKKLKNWGLPPEITNKYEKRGITEMFDWQVDCLSNKKVLSQCRNLVYSAPTSAGKTLVAEILTLQTVLERQKKVIIILPFVSIVREKMFYFQDILSSSGVRVEGFMGSQSPPGGLQAVHIAICTIEKANSLINKLLDEGNISELGAVVVDELHLLGDPNRGYILELLLTKIKYVSLKSDEVKVQIIGMSATLPNLEILANWLDAELFITEFRPIPLNEYCLVENKYYDKNGLYVGLLENQKNVGLEGDYVLTLCLETLREGCSVLIFCMTKNRCENLAQSIASSFYKLGCSSNEQGMILREQLNSECILETLEQLKNSPVGLDQVLKKIVSFGVAYHHAGLTFDERDIIEGAFKSGAIRVLVATSTLSSGVNLPARKVIIRSPLFQKQTINILSYKQMIGRAGRMGKDSKGESILMCTQAEQKIGFELMMGNLDPVESCIETEDKFMRAILEMIASQDICTKSDLDLYTKCTLLFTQENVKPAQNFLLEKTLKELVNCELIRTQKDGDRNKYVATPLGKACLSSSLAPNDGLSLFCELQKARQCLVLETDLHLIYLVTPYSVSSQWNNMDWLHLLTLWESLTAAMKRVGELVGVQESFIICCLRGTKHVNYDQNKLNIHKRFYTALALQDLVNEVPLSEVAQKFQCARGFLQGLQQASSTFAGMVTAFCHQLGWKNMEMLISQFQDRLQFGIHSDLLDLMKLPSLNGVRARALFDAGFETIANIASAESNVIENILHKSVPFQSEKVREGDDDVELRKRNKIKNIWITGFRGMTTSEAAVNLILEARKYLIQEIGVVDIKWKDIKSSELNRSPLNKSKNNILSMDTYSENNMNVKKMSEANDHIKEGVNEDEVKSSPVIAKSQHRIKHVNIRISNKTTRPYQIHGDSDEQFTNVEMIDNINISDIAHNVQIDEKMKSPFNQDYVWDSLNFTEAIFDNISKPTSNNILSPNISFGTFSNNSNNIIGAENNVSKSESLKDISLFSSDGDNSSIFEDSLNFDLLPHSVMRNNIVDIKKKVTNDINVTNGMKNNSSDSIVNIFKSFNFDIEEDEKFKLVYEDEKKSPDKKVSINNISQEIEISNTQEVKETIVKSTFISPLKRRADFNKNSTDFSAKKLKKIISCQAYSKPDTFPVKMNQNSENLVLKFEKKIVNCYILRGNDNCENFSLIENAEEASIVFDTNAKETKALIGSNIYNKTKNVSEIIHVIPEETMSLKGIAIYFNNLCLYLDIISLKNILPVFKCKLKRLFSNAYFKFRMLSTKANYLHIKKWLKKDLFTQCFDITLAEWLLDSDEKMSRIFDLINKYCNIDLCNTEISVNFEKKDFNNLNTHEMACLKAWCIWNISQEQVRSLEKCQYIKKTLDTENQVSKILGCCEYYGITVDKDLASQLLIDVKNSIEILQKKAFKLCGYHFNFNSPKDVAKVLGLYKGRKISTKKSVLTAHNSTMASIVIYWRKLNSILTKTLFPLTQQAIIYSSDNRISPSYTMYTCTGRISMHEPNLQNVPRTFSIPLKYLTVEDKTEICGVKEFNCRNIFKASPGHVFVSADYCQLEMRVLTHYSKDPVLTNIMHSNEDVFKSIAASWSGVAEEQVDDDLRQKAKQLCYGILYGMGNRTLSHYLDVNELEAALFMDTFYKTYPAIKVFTKQIVDECKKNGYIETLMKRRRYLPDINSNVASRRGTAERQAVNTTIQGSAADIAKAAMCAIDKKTSRDVDKPRLILQMHDELIYEVIESKKNSFIAILKSLMEQTIDLNVPLPVKVKVGYTWGKMEGVQ